MHKLGAANHIFRSSFSTWMTGTDRQRTLWVGGEAYECIPQEFDNFARQFFKDYRARQGTDDRLKHLPLVQDADKAMVQMQAHVRNVKRSLIKTKAEVLRKKVNDEPDMNPLKKKLLLLWWKDMQSGAYYLQDHVPPRDIDNPEDIEE